ncbi:MAG: hypothetical protein RLZZ367_1366 [Bacteroidota bacterium]|jgi:glycosyltransferase involved in cell wall biosynthesis
MNNRTPKTILFFSLHYPFHFSDSYLDDEFNLLAQNFDNRIVVTANTFSHEKRPMPEGVVLYRYNAHQSRVSAGVALGLLFKPFFYNEIYSLLFKYKIPISITLLKELVAFYGRAQNTSDFVNKLMHEQRIDVNGLLIYSYWMLEGSFAAALLRQRYPQIKTIARAHSLDVYFERTAIKYHPFRRFILSRLNRLYFISENARCYFTTKHFLANEEKIKTAISRIGFNAHNNFIDTLPTNTLRIISVGYVQALKRIDLIIDTLAIMDINVEWVHVGHSNHNEQDFVAIQQYALQKLGAKPNIKYTFTGKTEKKDLFALYEQKPFDVFLNVSETEGIPVSMMEAMSYSVPVIGTNVGGVAEIVDDGVNGFLLQPYTNATEVKQSLLRFMALGAAEYKAMRLKAFETWNTKYNAETNNRNFVSSVMALFNKRA